LRFVNEGTYQVITRIDSKKDGNSNAIALASFNVFVPVQLLGSINLNYLIPLLLPAGVVGGVIGTIIVIAFVVIKAGYSIVYLCFKQ
jgi:hypothetical protein